MTEDISKNTLMVLVILTIVVSLLGTWTVINEAGKVKGDNYVAPDMPTEDSKTAGKVTLRVVEPPEPVDVTGKVTLMIV